MDNMIRNVKGRLEDVKSLMCDNTEFQNERRERGSSNTGRHNGQDGPEPTKTSNIQTLEAP